LCRFEDCVNAVSGLFNVENELAGLVGAVGLCLNRIGHLLTESAQLLG
jgi:hypothetical protein